MIIKPLKEITPDYNFLMGYRTGVPKPLLNIEGVTSIFMGMWNDYLIGYKGYAINYPYIIDGLFAAYEEESVPPADYESESYKEWEEKFDQWLINNKDLLYEALDNVIESYENERRKENNVCA